LSLRLNSSTIGQQIRRDLSIISACSITLPSGWSGDVSLARSKDIAIKASSEDTSLEDSLEDVKLSGF
jgi:hypothetical protein